MKIGFATCDWSQTIMDAWGNPTPGGSGYARMVMPGTRLQHEGDVECVIGVLVSERRALEDGTPGPRRLGVQTFLNKTNHTDCDVLILQRWMQDEIVEHMQEHRATGGCPIVNDVDDWFWGLDPRNNAFKATHPKNDPRNNRDHYHSILSLSDCITVSTPYLADRIGSMCPGVRIEVVPNAIDIHRYTTHPPTDTTHPTLGWVGAMPWRSGDLEEVQSVVRDSCRTLDLPFHHSGVVLADEEVRGLYERLNAGDTEGMEPHVLANLTEHHNWFRSAGELMGVERHTESPMQSIYDYPSMFDAIDVGIVPLSDRPFNYAKSWIKGTEYAASGVPFIASAMPEYVRLQKEYGFGRTAQRAKDWLREVKKMTDPVWRNEQRERCVEGVKALDIEVHWQDWYSVYAEVAWRG